MSESQPRALITGVTGQDGGYLAELLLAKGYEVHGLVRPGETAGDHLSRVRLSVGRLEDLDSLRDALASIRPREVYNLAAASSVAESFQDPLTTCDVTGLGVLRLLEAIRSVDQRVRLLQASSAEIFAGASASPQDENTPVCPRSPYGVAKAFGHHIVQTYRNGHGIFAANAILYNHESPRRGLQFVSRKITDGVARIASGLATELRLGNLEVARDWGYAPDYVRAMHLVLQQDAADDFVIATGRLHTLPEFLERAFAVVGLDWKQHVVADAAFVRPSEPVELRGDAGRARTRLGWEPTVSFDELVREMVEADLARLAVPGAAENAGR